MKRESRITMAKEVLFISESTVRVDYDFRNDTDADITTDVAFPIPDYSLEMEDIQPSRQGFDGFKLWVNGKPVQYKTEARAMVGNHDYSALLESTGVDVASYGHSIDNDTQPQIKSLSKTQREQLEKAGVIDKEYDAPNWKVRKKYYWSQTFPAHAITHIRHEYTPVLGNSNSIAYGTMLKNGKVRSEDWELASVCPTPPLLRTLREDTQRPHHVVGIDYVDFILTTANTWKRPIEDFTLIVEKPPIDHDPNHPPTGVNFVSFCWDGPIEKIDADHFKAHITNLIPKKELRVGFLAGYKMNDF